MNYKRIVYTLLVQFWRKKRLKANILLAVLTLCNYGLVYISPIHYWLIGFFSLSLPILLLLNIFFVIYWLLIKPKCSLISGLVLAMGQVFIFRTFAWNFQHTTTSSAVFSVLSYNVRVFNSYQYLQQEYLGYAEKIIQWVAQHPAEIKCLQEFYHQESSELFNTVRELAQKRQYYFYSYPTLSSQNQENYFGLIILSKYPIIQGQKIVIGERKYPQAIYADVKIGKDTIRIFNLHLQSMAIDERKIFQKYAFWQQVESNFCEIARKLRYGFVNRAKQIEKILPCIEQSPYPVIVCADLNDVPYSYTYNVLRSRLQNAFEAKGKGWGFSYNGKLFFLRIDNQFFDEQKLYIHHFQTLTQVPYSDHFPLVGMYQIR
ncbi:MAG: endonuclease/exonuclease/phosphatase family protein [Microscillaceae bacterium]|nr:endonuclease/exonuclease/phosphatase family protein [Microscillaceae bacterium]MDW8461900.1 endonuclease/exonuclease/phosphatase family protein [Cytophagales bacterium]